MIPKIFQSSVDPEQVSLTITSIGKAGAGVIVFLGMVGLVDPVLATQAWGNFVASWITLVPAIFAVYHTSYAMWGLFRKIGVRLVSMFSKTTDPAQQ